LDISEQIVSSETINKMKELMSNVINGNNEGTTGRGYRVEGLDLIGKTGTSQYYNIEGGYSTGKNNYIYSFAGMFPKDDPEIIIYGSVKNPSWNTGNGLAEMVTTVSKDIAKYLNINVNSNTDGDSKEYVVESFINKNVEKVKETLELNGIKFTIIGDGNIIIKQSEEVGNIILSGDRIILVTNGTNISMPSIYGWSRQEIIMLCDLLNIKCEFEGYGYASTQSIGIGTNIIGDEILKVSLTNRVGE